MGARNTMEMYSSIETIHKHEGWIDAAKGYGMLMVIFAHMGVGAVGLWIYSFHMPLFFFLSGVVFSQKYNFKTFLHKKIKSIVIPYFMLGIPLILVCSFENMLQSRFELSILIGYIKAYLVQKRVWTLWFLACLFWLNLLFFFIITLIKQEKLRACFVCFLAVFGLAYYRLEGGALPWNVDVCFTALPFFYAGYCFKNHYEQIKRVITRKRAIYICGIAFGINVIAGALSYMISGEVLDMYGIDYGCEPLVYLSAFAGIVFCICISHWLHGKIVCYIGRNSLVYLAWHNVILIPIVIRVMNAVVPYKQGHNSMIDLIVKFPYRAIELLIVVIALTVCNEVIIHTRLKFIVGK